MRVGRRVYWATAGTVAAKAVSPPVLLDAAVRIALGDYAVRILARPLRSVVTRRSIARSSTWRVSTFVSFL
jgi:hypothetical protein